MWSLLCNSLMCVSTGSRASAVPGAGAGSVVAGDAEACARISGEEPDRTVDAEPAEPLAAMAKGPLRPTEPNRAAVAVMRAAECVNLNVTYTPQWRRRLFSGS